MVILKKALFVVTILTLLTAVTSCSSGKTKVLGEWTLESDEFIIGNTHYQKNLIYENNNWYNDDGAQIYIEFTKDNYVFFSRETSDNKKKSVSGNYEIIEGNRVKIDLEDEQEIYEYEIKSNTLYLTKLLDQEIIEFKKGHEDVGQEHEDSKDESARDEGSNFTDIKEDNADEKENDNTISQNSNEIISIDRISNINFTEEITGEMQIETFISSWDFEPLKTLYHNIELNYNGEILQRNIIKENMNLYAETKNMDTIKYWIANEDDTIIYTYQEPIDDNSSMLINYQGYDDLVTNLYRIDMIMGDISIPDTNSIKIGEFNGEKIVYVNQTGMNESEVLLCYSYKYGIQLCYQYIENGEMLYEMVTNGIQYNTNLEGYNYRFTPPDNIEFEVVDGAE